MRVGPLPNTSTSVRLEKHGNGAGVGAVIGAGTGAAFGDGLGFEEGVSVSKKHGDLVQINSPSLESTKGELRTAT